jgi:hypothetical protein
MRDPVVPCRSAPSTGGIPIPQRGQWVVVAIPARHIYLAQDGKIVRTLDEFSTGRAGSLTPIGSFEMDPDRRFRIHHGAVRPGKNGRGAAMPFSLFFCEQAAFHGGDPHVPSDGSIHLQLDDAKWLFDWVGKNRVGVNVLGPAITIHE